MPASPNLLCFALLYPDLFCLVLPFFALPCLVLSCLVLSCLVFSRFVLSGVVVFACGAAACGARAAAHGRARAGARVVDGERARALQEPKASLEQTQKLFQDDIVYLQNEIRAREAQLTMAQERLDVRRLAVDKAVGQAGVRAATKDLRLASTQLTSDRAVRA